MGQPVPNNGNGGLPHNAPDGVTPDIDAVKAAAKEGGYELTDEQAKHASVHPDVDPIEFTTIHQKLHAQTMLYLFLALIVTQIGLYFWKKSHYKSYQKATLITLWCTPLYIAFTSGYTRFIVVHLVWSALTLYHVKLASSTPMCTTTPRVVYSFFYRCFQICNFATMAGYSLMMLQVLVMNAFLTPGLRASLTTQAVYLMFYGIYYGVLSREVTELVTTIIKYSMGFSSDKDGLASQKFRVNCCGMCYEGLGVGTETDAEGGKIIELECCKAQFHEWCLRGWSMIAKRNTCPVCRERVKLRAALGQSPWQKQNHIFTVCLDYVRILVGWNPLICLVLVALFKSFGMHLGF